MSFERILDKYLDNEIKIEQYDYQVNMIDIEKFEKEIGFSLPDDFKEFSVSKYNTAEVSVDKSIWERSGCGEGGPAWTFMYGFDIHGFSDELDDEYHVRKLSQHLKKISGIIAAPFMNVKADSDPYCLKADQKIYQYNYSGYELIAFDMSFTEFFEYQMKELFERKEKYKQWKKDN